MRLRDKSGMDLVDQNGVFWEGRRKLEMDSRFDGDDMVIPGAKNKVTVFNLYNYVVLIYRNYCRTLGI
jgi:hypothetical protein